LGTRVSWFFPGTHWANEGIRWTAAVPPATQMPAPAERSGPVPMARKPDTAARSLPGLQGATPGTLRRQFRQGRGGSSLQGARCRLYHRMNAQYRGGMPARAVGTFL